MMYSEILLYLRKQLGIIELIGCTLIIGDVRTR